MLTRKHHCVICHNRFIAALFMCTRPTLQSDPMDHSQSIHASHPKSQQHVSHKRRKGLLPTQQAFVPSTIMIIISEICPQTPTRSIAGTTLWQDRTRLHAPCSSPSPSRSPPPNPSGPRRSGGHDGDHDGGARGAGGRDDGGYVVGSGRRCRRGTAPPPRWSWYDRGVRGGSASSARQAAALRSIDGERTHCVSLTRFSIERTTSLFGEGSWTRYVHSEDNP